MDLFDLHRPNEDGLYREALSTKMNNVASRSLGMRLHEEMLNPDVKTSEKDAQVGTSTASAGVKRKHVKPVFAVTVFQPDVREGGKPFIATGSADGIVRVYPFDTASSSSSSSTSSSSSFPQLPPPPSAEPLFVLQGHTASVTCLETYHPQGQDAVFIISGSRDRSVRVWYVKEQRSVKTLVGHADTVWCICVVQGKGQEPLVVGGGLDGCIKIWSMMRGDVLKSIDVNDGAIMCLAAYYPPHGSAGGGEGGGPMLLSGGEDQLVTLWSIQTGEIVKTFQGHTDAVMSLSVLSDYTGELDPLKSAYEQKNTIVVSGSMDGTVRVWCMATCVTLRVLKKHRGTVFSVCAIPSHITTIRTDAQGVEYVYQALQGGETHAHSHLQTQIGGGGGVSLKHTHPHKKKSSVTTSGGGEGEGEGSDDEVFEMAQGPDSDDDDDVADKNKPLASVLSRGGGGKGPGGGGGGGGEKEGPVFASQIGWFSRARARSQLKRGEDGESVDASEVEGGKRHVNTSTRCVIEAMIVTGGKDGIIYVWSLATGRILRTIAHHMSAVTSLTGMFNDPNRLNKSTNKDNDKIFALPISPSFPSAVLTIVSGSMDSFVVSTSYGSLEQEALDAYNSDMANIRLPSNLLLEVPDEFRSWARIYRLAMREKMDIDQLFAQELFFLFVKAIHPGSLSEDMKKRRPDFLAKFLPLCHTGLLMSTYFPPVDWSSREYNCDAIGDAEEEETGSCSTFIARCDKCLSFCRPEPETDLETRLSLLGVAIHVRDIRSTTVIVNVWLELLNQAPSCWLDQCRGPFTRLLKHDLISLSKVYPTVFQTFICGLKLQKSHEFITRECSAYLGPQKTFLKQGVSGNINEDIAMWKVPNKTAKEPMVGKFVPLARPADLDMLRAYVETSLTLGNVKMFESDVARVATRYSWSKFGLALHKSRAAFFLVYMFFFTMFVIMESNVGVCLILAVFVFYFLYREFRQVIYEGSGLHHFFRFWPFIELFSAALILASMSMRFLAISHSQISEKNPSFKPGPYKSPIFDYGSLRFLLSTAVLLQWGRILSFFRAFESTGPLIAMIIQIAMDIRYYLFLLIIIMFGFSLAFWTLCSQNLNNPLVFDKPYFDMNMTLTVGGNPLYGGMVYQPGQIWWLNGGYPAPSSPIGLDDKSTNDDPQGSFPFSTLQGAFLESFVFLTGQFSIDGFRTCGLHNDGYTIDMTTRGFAIFLGAMFAVLVNVMMVNVLIALMTESYSRLSQAGQAQSRLMQAQLMCENAWALEIRRLKEKGQGKMTMTPRIIQTLMRADDEMSFDDELEEEDEEGGGGTDASIDDQIIENLSRFVSKRTEAVDTHFDDQDLEIDEVIRKQEKVLFGLQKALDDAQIHVDGGITGLGPAYSYKPAGLSNGSEGEEFLS